MTWQEDIEKGDPALWFSAVDTEESMMRMLVEDRLDESGYMWSLSRMWYPNSQPHKIMIFIDPDHIIETYAKSRIEALVAGWLALKRVKA